MAVDPHIHRLLFLWISIFIKTINLKRLIWNRRLYFSREQIFFTEPFFENYYTVHNDVFLWDILAVICFKIRDILSFKNYCGDTGTLFWITVFPYNMRHIFNIILFSWSIVVTKIPHRTIFIYSSCYKMLYLIIAMIEMVKF